MQIVLLLKCSIIKLRLRLWRCDSLLCAEELFMTLELVMALELSLARVHLVLAFALIHRRLLCFVIILGSHGIVLRHFRLIGRAYHPITQLSIPPSSHPLLHLLLLCLKEFLFVQLHAILVNCLVYLVKFLAQKTLAFGSDPRI